MPPIREWFKKRGAGRKVAPGEGSIKITEPVKGGFRTKTLFPPEAFLPYEQMIKIARQVKREVDEWPEVVCEYH